MPRKSNSEKPITMDQKTFLKLMEKREDIQKVITKNQKKLDKVNAQLAMFSDWLKALTVKI